MSEEELALCEKYENAVYAKFWLTIIGKKSLTAKGIEELNNLENYINANANKYFELTGK